MEDPELKGHNSLIIFPKNSIHMGVILINVTNYKKRNTRTREMFGLSIKKPLGTFSLFVTPYDKCNINKRDSYLTKNIFT